MAHSLSELYIQNGLFSETKNYNLSIDEPIADEIKDNRKDKIFSALIANQKLYFIPIF